jgi:flagellar assembly protein FliH
MVNRALNNLDKSNEYTIRVSKEDYDYLTERKGVLLNAIGREVNLVINEDPELTKNQCLIETDTRVIDCSLDVQLNNLITDLKLLCEV